MKEFSSFGKTPCEWLCAWINLKFDHETDNIDEYIQKFTALANLLNCPYDQQVQVFKMAMPEAAELQIWDCATMEQCIAQAKQCLAICQPTTLVGKVSSVSLAQSSPPTTTPRSPSSQPKGRSTNATNRQSRPIQYQNNRQNSFQGFRQYPGFPNSNNNGNFRPILHNRSLSNQRNNRWNFSNFPTSRSQTHFRNGQTLVRCYNCNKLGHIAANCFPRPNPNVHCNFRNQQHRQFNNGQYQQSPSHSRPCPHPNFK